MQGLRRVSTPMVLLLGLPALAALPALQGFAVAPAPSASLTLRQPRASSCARPAAGSSSSSTQRRRLLMCGEAPVFVVPDGQAAAGPRASTWSNPGGQDLLPVGEGLYVAERPFVWNGIDVGGRMTVAKLSDGSLWVHSPVELDEPLREALGELGPVAHIVSPNYEHVKYARQWVEAYPAAKSYACPGLADREPEVGFTREVGASPEDASPPEWGGEIQTCFMDCETNPFTGKPFFNEVVFFHWPTKSLITADLFWNYPTEVPFGTRAWKWGMDKVYLPFFKRFMVTDSGAFRAKVNQILSWGPEVIVPCHGLVVRSKAAETLLETLLGGGSSSE